MQVINKKEIEAVWEEPKAKKNWPSDGRIVAQNLAYKYREKFK